MSRPKNAVIKGSVKYNENGFADTRARVVAMSIRIKPLVIYYRPFQGAASVVVYSILF